MESLPALLNFRQDVAHSQGVYLSERSNLKVLYSTHLIYSMEIGIVNSLRLLIYYECGYCWRSFVDLLDSNHFKENLYAFVNAVLQRVSCFDIIYLIFLVHNIRIKYTFLFTTCTLFVFKLKTMINLSV